MTTQVLAKLPDEVRNNIEELKRMYKNLPDCWSNIHARVSGYTCGLRDAGLITDRERQILFDYVTTL